MNKDKSEDNNLWFWAIIIIVLGIAGYRFVLEKEINTIITLTISIASLSTGSILIILVIVFSIREVVEQKESIFSNKHIKIMTIIIGGILIITPYWNIDYLHINTFFTIQNILIILLSISIILILYYIITDYIEKKRLFTEHIEKYSYRRYSNTYEVALAIAEIESYNENNTGIERLFHEKTNELLSYLELLKKKYIEEYHKTETKKAIGKKVQQKEEIIEQQIIDKLVEYFKERNTSQAIPEWALNMRKETIQHAVDIYKDYSETEYHKEQVWRRAVDFMLEYKGLPNDYQSLQKLEQELYLKAYRLMKEHKLEKESEENPEILEEDEELATKYFYQANELTAEQRHRFIHNYGYRIKPFIHIETGKRGNNLIIKSDPTKESDYHFCIKHLLANVHKKNAYIEYPIEQLRTDIMININGNLYAFEIETGNNKALQIERKIIWLNKHFKQWYIICSRDNKKKYKKYVDKKKSHILTATQAYNKILEINHISSGGT